MQRELSPEGTEQTSSWPIVQPLQGTGYFQNQRSQGVALGLEILPLQGKGRRAGHTQVIQPQFVCCISLATRAVQPVWWLAPRPTPVSPLKYS